MEKAEIDSFVDGMTRSIMGTMQEIIVKGDEALPQIWFFSFDRSDQTPAVAPVIGLGHLFETDAGKSRLRPAVKHVWGQMSQQHPSLELLAVIIVSDAWVEHPSAKEFEKLRKHGRPAPFEPKPGMGEMVMAQVSFATKELIYTKAYERKDKGVVFAEKVVVEESLKDVFEVSRAMGMWPL